MRVTLKNTEQVVLSQTMPCSDTWRGVLDYELNIKCDRLIITLYYVKEAEGFKVTEDKPTEGEFGTLSIEVELDGFFEAPTVSFRDNKGDLLHLPRHGSSASMHIPLPKGGFSAADGIGDYTKLVEW